MPRRRRDEQAPAAAAGQPYGERQDQIQAQNIIPLPQVNPAGAAPGAGMGGGTPAGTAPPPGGSSDAMAQALEAALSMPATQGGGLMSPSTRPTEPVTTGLTSGTGAGPEAVTTNRAQLRTVAQTYITLAQLTGNPLYRRLAQAAIEQGV